MSANRLLHRQNLCTLRAQPRRSVLVHFLKCFPHGLKLYVKGGERVDYLAAKSVQCVVVNGHPGILSHSGGMMVTDEEAEAD